MNDFIPVNEPLLDGNEQKYINECIESGWISAEGPFVEKFETEFALRVGRKYGIAVCNGTAALEIAVRALDLQPGDEVILPTFTIISCAAAIIRSGAKPVLVDSDPLTWNMDANQLEAKISSHTKAIMVVHIYGLPVDMDPMITLAQKYGLKIIEDAAEMHGQTYKGKSCGSFGEISTFSFYANKHITTGEGGMVLTDDENLGNRCRALRNLCFIPQRRFIHDELGYNFRLTSLQAALGLAQLERLDEHVGRKRFISKMYTELLADIPGLQLPLAKTQYADNIYWIYGLILKDELPFEADEVIKRLSNLQVGSRPFFWPMHEQPVFKKMGLFTNEHYPISERMARRGLYLPSGLTLSKEQIKLVVQRLKTSLE
jgi:perosamine synthetase